MENYIKGDAAEITGTNGEWTQITSGNVNGYVKTAYCVTTGNDALAYAQQACVIWHQLILMD